MKIPQVSWVGYLNCFAAHRIFLRTKNLAFVDSPLNVLYENLVIISWMINKHAVAKSLQSCPTLCNPIDVSPPGSSVSGILQARTLEWVAISFSNTWQWKVQVKSPGHSQFLVTPWTAAHQASSIRGIFQARGLEWSAIVFS